MADANSIASRKLVPLNRMDKATTAMGNIDQGVAFLNGAIAIIDGSDKYETDRDAIHAVYLIEAAIERLEKVRDQIDQDSVRHHG